jgi:hypothetical protein
MATETQDADRYLLGLTIEFAVHPPLCDLSGVVPFAIIIGVGRSKVPNHIDDPDGKHNQQVVIPFKGSLLDVKGALRSGLIRLVEADTLPAPQDAQSETFTQNDGIEAPELIEIGPSGLGTDVVSVRTPQVFRYELEHKILQTLKEGALYVVEVKRPTKADDDLWVDGNTVGIPWWKLASSFQREATTPRVRLIGTNPKFLAEADPHLPPSIDYKLDISPSTISISQPTDITFSVQITLNAQSPYTIRVRTEASPQLNVFGDPLSLHSLVVEDIDTAEVLSQDLVEITPSRTKDIWKGNPRSHFRQLEPGEPVIMKASFTAADAAKAFDIHALRINGGIHAIVGRKLHLKIRSDGMRQMHGVARVDQAKNDTWWIQGTIDDMLGDDGNIKPSRYILPLHIASEASADFRVMD